jgi:endonuclease-3
LFAAYPTIAALAAAAQSDVEEIVHPAGFFRVKARHLIDSAGRLLHEFGGEVPRTMAELVTLPGVSRKTANIVLSQAFGKAEGIAVDTHVTRLTQRMGLTQDHRPVKIEQDLMQVVPRRDWGAWNTLLVDHGRAVCRARRPECRACIIARWCPRRKVELVWKKGLT